MKNILVVLCFFIWNIYSLKAQKNSQFLFISNIQNSEELDHILDFTSIDNQHPHIISLGDNAPQQLHQLSESCPECKLRTTVGDKDLKHLRNRKHSDYKFKKKRICPDPEVKELDDNHVMITLNSNWFINHESTFDALNYDCDFYNEIHLLEELEDILEDYEAWNKIIVAHHGMLSISELAGKGLWTQNFIPLYGQMYQAFRKNIGYAQDLSSPLYHRYISLLSKVIQKHDKICIISGHDYLNHVIDDGPVTHINVNSSSLKNRFSKDKNTRFVSDASFVLNLQKVEKEWQFTLQSTAETIPLQNLFKVRVSEDPTAKPEKFTPQKVSAVAVASEKYDANQLVRLLMGNGYREEWSTPVEAPLLDISQYDGGLKPYAIGGGLQTLSIKFKSKNGKKYAFRVLDKRPEKSLSDVARESIYRVIVQELITTMHPYGPLVADVLMDATDIIHIKPELFILQDHPLLDGVYRPFVGKIGTLEEKPKGEKKDREGFYDADKVVSTYEMFIKLRKSHKHKIDPMAYVKARLMDMLIGDWDRHEDNWKWAMYKEDGERIYRPIPKDRDHVFSKWSGMIPNIADLVINNAEDFGGQFGNMRHLNFKARFLDRELAREVDLEMWLEGVAYIKNTITDEVIDRAVKALPTEVYDFHAEEINRRLKSRVDDLPRFIKAYYKELNEKIFITGTNKKDFFKVERLADGQVHVLVGDLTKQEKMGDIIYERTLEPEVVQEIYLFGLDGKDRFEISGEAEQSIKVRIIGGSDEDRIEDKSSVGGHGRLTQVYDSADEDKIDTSEETIIKRPSRAARYDLYAFDYNWLIPQVTLRNSSGNGFGFGAGFNYLIRGFNKPQFAKKWTFGGVYYPDLKAFRLDAGFTFRHFVGLYDLNLRTRYSALYDRYPFFYGIGNETTLRRIRRIRENSIDYDYLDFEAGLIRTFAQKSKWSNSIIVENHDVSNRDNRMVIDSTISGFGNNTFVGLRSQLELDFTDNSQYPEDGAQFDLSLTGRINIDGTFSSNLDTRFSYFKTLDLGLKTTFIGSLHYKQANGNPTFYHLSRLGSQTNFRGYTRNRFIDKYAILYNTEVRILLGTIKTPLIQFIVGVFGLYDGGRVWNDSAEFYTGEWNNSYGGGFFFAPGSKDYTLSFLLARPEDDFTYSKLQFGFDF